MGLARTITSKKVLLLRLMRFRGNWQDIYINNQLSQTAVTSIMSSVACYPGGHGFLFLKGNAANKFSRKKDVWVP